MLDAQGIVCSMSSVGPCGDNAPVESFFGRMKCELAVDEMFATRDQPRGPGSIHLASTEPAPGEAD